VPECSAKPAFPFATPSVRTPREYPPPLNFTDGPAPARVPAKRVRRVFSPPHGVGMHAFPLRSRSTRLHHHAPPTTNTHTHTHAHRPSRHTDLVLTRVSTHVPPSVPPSVRPSVLNSQSVVSTTQRNATQRSRTANERTKECSSIRSFPPTPANERHSTARHSEKKTAQPGQPAHQATPTCLLACRVTVTVTALASLTATQND